MIIKIQKFLTKNIIERKLLIISIVSFPLCIIVTFFIKPCFYLNENQLLYSFTTMAQIVGSMFGLTLTAYIFFIDKFKKTSEIEEQYFEAIESLSYKYYINLAIIAIICGVEISICIFGIISNSNNSNLNSFIINQSGVLFIIEIIAILTFGINLLDSKKLTKETTQLKVIAEEYFKEDKKIDVSKKGDFNEFLKYYNLLEKLIIDFAGYIIGEDYKYNKANKPRLIQSLKVLIMKEIINKQLFDEINELRQYRNGLVHGTDFNVSKYICDRLINLYNAIKDVYECYPISKDENLYYEKIRAIYELSK